MSGRFNKAVAVLVFGIYPASTLAGPVATIWSTGFEDGLPANATNIGTGTVVALTAGAHSGVRRFQFVGDLDPVTVSSLTLPVDATGYSDLSLEFAGKFNNGIEGNDLATVAVSAFDNPLQAPIIIPFSDQPTGDWSIVRVDLPAELSNQPLNISFAADFNSSTGDAWSVDDLLLSGTPVPEPLTLSLLAFGVIVAARRRS